MSPGLACLAALRSRLEQPRVISCAALTVLSPLAVATGLRRRELGTAMAGLAGCVLGPVGLAIAIAMGPR